MHIIKVEHDLAQTWRETSLQPLDPHNILIKPPCSGYTLASALELPHHSRPFIFRSFDPFSRETIAQYNIQQSRKVSRKPFSAGYTLTCIGYGTPRSSLVHPATVSTVHYLNTSWYCTSFKEFLDVVALQRTGGYSAWLCRQAGRNFWAARFTLRLTRFSPKTTFPSFSLALFLSLLVYAHLLLPFCCD